MTPKVQVQGHLRILAAQMPVSPKITAEMPTKKLMIMILSVMLSRPAVVRFESAIGETPC